MLDIIMTFKGYDERNEPFSTVAEGVSRRPEKDHPKFPGSNIECDMDNVDHIKFSGPNRVVKVYWSKRIFGLEGNRRLMSEEGLHDVALVETCGGDIGGHLLIVRGEPTTDDRIGFSIANKRNKVLFAGTGDIIKVGYYTVESNERIELDTLVATFKITYPWKRASVQGCAHGSGAVRNTGTTPAKLTFETPDGGG
jgi:hypothetical protein